ncbi:MAG: AEC family transporter [Liquorilactobacillus hordei]|uniref:Malate transport protein n=2 Tax=Liquorilactobacillus hordei TaxID=468911 RepID=A0A0R1MGG4_9LACO|nr:AEC family transporter [Liquorilactobacillus hordei]KRL06713.1 malate transport protein [Liquorilactobacillus hordei DSM 19519]QYH52290.1 AEC family transporter [Liquorilactobacillus hordei DSM 19519]
MNVSLLFNQIVLMFCLMLVGVLANKLKFFHEQTANDLTNILLYIVSPCLIIKSFETSYSTSRIHTFLMIALGTLVLYLIQIFLSTIIFKSVKDYNIRRITKFSSIYSNAGFIGIPLVSSLFGSSGVFYAVVPLAFFNLFNWTHGISMFAASNYEYSIIQRIRKVLFNPNILAIILGMSLFCFSIKIPQLPSQLINYISSVNTPISMLVIGNSLANITLKNCKLTRAIIVSLILRNIIYPLLTLIIMPLLGVSGLALSTIILMMACPVGGIVVLFTLQVHDNVNPAITLMGISTLLSLITIPFIFFISNLFI